MSAPSIGNCRWCGELFDVPNRWRCCLDKEYLGGKGSLILDTNRVYDFGVGQVHVLVRDEHYELLVYTPDCDQNGPYEHVDVPEHEKLGPLPDKVRRRIQDARCGRTTRAGKPCRNRRRDCRHHR